MAAPTPSNTELVSMGGVLGTFASSAETEEVKAEAPGRRLGSGSGRQGDWVWGAGAGVVDSVLVGTDPARRQLPSLGEPRVTNAASGIRHLRRALKQLYETSRQWEDSKGRAPSVAPTACTERGPAGSRKRKRER